MNSIAKINNQVLVPRDIDENQSILIADDNEDIRNLLFSAFKEKFTVYTAVNGYECFQLAMSNLPDIILSDINMPLVDGFDLANRLTENPRTNHIPILLITGKTGPEDHTKALSLGAIDYIAKPFEMESLVKKVTNILDKQQKLIFFERERRSHNKNFDLLNLKDKNFIDKVTQIVSENYQDSGFSVDILKNSLHITERQLQRHFKRLFQVAPAKFIKSYRLDKAREMLSNGHSIAITYESVGFNSQSYFSHSFKSNFGKSPKYFIANNS
jgi:YesN/AraC family two-component response regulator